jgi:hypothetical protein
MQKICTVHWTDQSSRQCARPMTSTYRHTDIHTCIHTYRQTDRQTEIFFTHSILSSIYSISSTESQNRYVFRTSILLLFLYGTAAWMEIRRENLGCSVGKLTDSLESSWNWTKFSVSTALTCSFTTCTLSRIKPVGSQTTSAIQWTAWQNERA